MTNKEWQYGYCSNCQEPLFPVWFTDEEYKIVNGIRIKTGRTKRACSHLVCEICLNNECVDDTFDESWR